MRTSTEVTGRYKPGDMIAVTHMPRSGIVCKCDTNYVLQFGERRAVVVSVVSNVNGRKEFGERVTWNEYKYTQVQSAYDYLRAPNARAVGTDGILYLCGGYPPEGVWLTAQAMFPLYGGWTGNGSKMRYCEDVLLYEGWRFRLVARSVRGFAGIWEIESEDFNASN